MRIVLFEDSDVRHLQPITLARPAYDVLCGGTTLWECMSLLDAPVETITRPYLRPYQRHQLPELNGLSPQAEPTLLVNAAMVPSRANREQVEKLCRSEHPCRLQSGTRLAAAWLSQPTEIQEDDGLGLALQTELIGEHPQLPGAIESKIELFRYPHDVVAWHTQLMAETLEDRIRRGRYREIRPGVFTGEDVEIHDMSHIDSTNGPVLLEDAVRIAPMACLRGPVGIGRGSCINEHALIRSHTFVGQHCRVGGEVQASVINSYTNKQHCGYLGHAWVGSWVNLGAGTSNSNLKNTYGTIRVETPDGMVDTGQQFLGCIIGDYTKSAINTAIFTGKRIGVCSMLYGFVTTDVPSFANYARSFGQMTRQPPAVVAQTQRRVFERRGITQQSWHIDLLEKMDEMTCEQARLADEPLSL